jgi:hypothetical protein
LLEVHPHPITWPGLYRGSRPHQSYLCATPPSTLDNADSNDTCLRTFFFFLINNELKTKRLKYFGHVLNLLAKAFLFGKNANVFKIEHAVNITLNRKFKKKRSLAKTWPNKKFHNICVWVRRSPQKKNFSREF